MDSYPAAPNLAAIMFGQARLWPDRPLFRWHDAGKWHGMTWRDFAERTAALARALRERGIRAGDRVVICTENRPLIPISEVALMALRAVPVPAYTTNTVADHAHILRDSGAVAAIVSNAALASRIEQAAAQALPLRLLLVADPEAVTPDRILFDSLATPGAPYDDIAAEAAAIEEDQLACLIYTSGTGGAPRGVMLPHRAILSNCRGAFELLRPLALYNETYLSFLPASHSFEHTVGQFYLPSLGNEVVYSRGIDSLAADFAAIRPTIIAVVPRILEILRGRILGGVDAMPTWRQVLFHKAIAIGTKRAERKRLSLLDMLLDPILQKLVRDKVLQRFGGRLHALVSGGARLEPEVGRFFAALGLRVIQGYGQTEAGPVISANPPMAIRVETVGVPLEGVDLRIAEDGEILVRGGLVMQGYWNRPDETEAAIRDGWLHTGDIGELDTDGYLHITDRKKDIIVLSGGDNISPARIETMLMREAEISQAVVAGEGRAGLMALIVPQDGASPDAIKNAIGRVNAHLSSIERIRRHVMAEPFTIENGLLTPTQKIRRPLVLRAYREKMEAG